MKKQFKRQLRNVVARIGRQNWQFPKQKLIVLNYHRILPYQHADLPIVQPGMVVHDHTFAMHIKVLKQRYELVQLSDWMRLAKDGQRVPDRACAITFDDGWRDNFDYAFPILQAEQVPATIFLVADLVGTNRSFWPEKLARLLWAQGQGLGPEIWNHGAFRWLPKLGVSYVFDGKAPNRDDIDEIITQAKRFSDAEIEKRLERMEGRLNGLNEHNGSDLLSWEHVRAMTASGLVEVGSHTRHHCRLTEAVDEETMLDEIKGSKDIIRSKAECEVATFCYPNGDATPTALRIVRDNYIAACSTIIGWNSVKSDPHMLKRIGVHQDIASDEKAFLARLSGWV